MSGDDDDGSVIIIIKRKARQAVAALNEPATSIKRWHIAAGVLVAFLAGLAL